MIRDRFFSRLFPPSSSTARSPKLGLADLACIRSYVATTFGRQPRHFMAGRHPGRPGSEFPFRDADSMSPMRGDVKRKCSSVLSWEEGVECIQPSVCSGETLSLRSVASGPGGRRFVLDGFITRWWSTATVLEATQADGSALVCQPWSYLRLKAYSFLGLCEGA